MVIQRAAGTLTPQVYTLGYIEDVGEPRRSWRPFSAALEVPRNAAHEATRIPRHEVNVVDRYRLVPKLRVK